MNARPNRAVAVADANRHFSITALIRRVLLALYVRRSRRALLSLDDHSLKDIGLTRFDAWRESNRALFDLENSPPPRTAVGQTYGEIFSATTAESGEQLSCIRASRCVGAAPRAGPES